ncbi:Hypothetical predicted protein [Octopus vulgaris]|uniref:Uncharacterized protein n=1 Tax=Octopus vulgaris TaxID=6645 RepID=A0AA36AZX5_OCTVU|nr:Hypothetical predicted protein [Octopus vulgaris]
MKPTNRFDIRQFHIMPPNGETFNIYTYTRTDLVHIPGICVPGLSNSFTPQRGPLVDNSTSVRILVNLDLAFIHLIKNGKQTFEEEIDEGGYAIPYKAHSLR